MVSDLPMPLSNAQILTLACMPPISPHTHTHIELIWFQRVQLVEELFTCHVPAFRVRNPRTRKARAGARVRVEFVRHHQMRDLPQAPDSQQVGRRVSDSPAQRDSPLHLRCVSLVLVEHVMGKVGHALREHRSCVQRFAIDEEDAMRVLLTSGYGLDVPIRDGRAVIVKAMKSGSGVDSVHESRESSIAA